MNYNITDLQIMYAHMGNEITALSKAKKNKLVNKQVNISEQIKGLERRRQIVKDDIISAAVEYTNMRIAQISKEVSELQSKIEIVK